METKQVCQLDSNNIFIGLAVAYESPLEKNVFLIPAGCLDVELPQISKGEYARWNGLGWNYNVIPIPIIDDNTTDITTEQSLHQQAFTLLRSSDYRVLQDKFIGYTEQQQILIMEYRAKLRQVINNELNELPELKI